MAYNYNHDCPFEAYITNLGKYNEGALVGEWVKFPTTYEELQKVFERIGIGSENEFGNVYEEWFITDYDCYVDGLHKVLGEYENLDELNYLAANIENMDTGEYERFEAAIDMGDYTSSVKDLINLTENLDKYDLYPDVHDHDDLGRLYLDEYGIVEIPDHLQNYIDYEAYGRDVAINESGSFTERGYIRDNRDSFTEYYDGSHENIPEEHLVMSKPEAEELAEDEKLEMATDLAFDLDEFFRQKDPQYAAAHPNDHAGKEVIADLLLEGKTAAIKDRLTEMAQPPDDELVSRVGAYEQATGYEAYLDTDVAAIREKLEQAQDEIRTYDIYQLKDFPDRREYSFFALDRLHKQGLSVDMHNYDKVYSGVMATDENLESVYTRFNVDRPADFTGHSLSMSDVVVVHQDGHDTAHYCDSFGFSEVPEFLTAENHLKNAEMAMEDDLGMIDGIINNGKKDVTPPGTDEKPSILERLSEAKRECSERKPPEVKKPDKGEPEHNL